MSKELTFKLDYYGFGTRNSKMRANTFFGDKPILIDTAELNGFSHAVLDVIQTVNSGVPAGSGVDLKQRTQDVSGDIIGQYKEKVCKGCPMHWDRSCGGVLTRRTEAGVVFPKAQIIKKPEESSREFNKRLISKARCW